MSAKTLIKAGWILTLGARTSNLTDADVLIEDGKVVELGTRIRARGAEVVDATNSIVMPGFIDTHRHVSRSLFRNIGELGVVAAEHYQPEDVYASTLIGLLGAIEAGITTVVDWADITPDQPHVEAALQAHHDSGLRTVFVNSSLGDAAGLTSCAFASPDLTGANLDRIPELWASARSKGHRIHAHAGISGSEHGVVSEMSNLLGEDVTLVHCAYLNDSEFDAVASSKAFVSLTPSSDMATGLPAPQIQKLIDRGIRPGLGVDDERLAPGDIFAQMRSTIAIQHATYFDLKLAGKGGLPNLMGTRDVIRHATVDGAQVAGLGDVTGSIQPGMQADIVILRADSPNIYPINDPIGAVVWGMDTSNIDWVFAAGEALMRDGAVSTDVERARALAVMAQGRVAEAAGMLVRTGSGDET